MGVGPPPPGPRLSDAFVPNIHPRSDKEGHKWIGFPPPQPSPGSLGLGCPSSPNPGAPASHSPGCPGPVPRQVAAGYHQAWSRQSCSRLGSTCGCRRTGRPRRTPSHSPYSLGAGGTCLVSLLRCLVMGGSRELSGRTEPSPNGIPTPCSKIPKFQLQGLLSLWPQGAS